MDVKGFVFKRLGKSDEVDLPVITGIIEKEQTQSLIVLNTLELLKEVSRSGEYSYLGQFLKLIWQVFGVSLISDNGLYLKLGTAVLKVSWKN